MIIDFYNRGGGGDVPSDVYTKEEVNALIANFITATTDDLVNYYLKSETYTQSEVDSLIGAIEGFHYEIAPSTSSVVDPQDNVLYLIGPDQTASGDQYEEYVYSNNAWVKIGDTSIDLAGYVTTSDLNTALANYVTSTELANTLAGYASLETISTVAISGSYNDLTDKPTIPVVPELATVATTGAYSDLTGTPALATVATTGAYSDLTGTPTMATVATTGSYNDLSDKPSIPVVPELSTVATTGDYNDLTNKPSIPDAVSGTNDGTNWTSITIGTETHDIPQGGSSSKIDLALMTPEEQQQFYVDFYVNNAHNYWDYCAMGYNVCGVQKMSQYTEIDLGEGETYVTDGSELGIFVGPDYQFKNGTQWGNEPIDELDNIYYYVWVFSPTDGLIEAATRIYSNVQPDWNVNDSDNKAFIKNKPSIPDAVSGVNDGTNWTSITIGTTTKAIPAGGGVAQQQADWAEDDTTDVTFIKNKPVLSTVATSGSYDDLTDKPAIPAAQVNSDWNADSGVAQILNRPTLSTVATSGSYNDLSDKLTAGDGITIGTDNVISADSQVISLTQAEYDQITPDPDVIYIITDATPVTLATVATSGAYADLTDTPTLATVATSGSYNDLTDKPTIPDAVSGTNDGTNWTSITIGTTTAAIPAGGGNAKERLDITQMTQSERAALFMQLYTGDYTTLNTYDIYVQFYPVTSIEGIDCNILSRGIQFTYNVIVTQCYDSENDKYLNWTQGNALFLAQDGTYTTDSFTAPFELGELGNVKASNPNDGDVLSYDSASGFWISTQVPVPALATVATTGAYSDLTGTPVLSTVATSGSYNDLTGTPTLATVATTGAYADLTGTPTIPDAVSGTNDGTNWTSLTIGTDTYAIPAGGSSAKIELMTLSLQEQLAFYQAVIGGTMKDFSQYTANGYPLINAYVMSAGVVIDVDGSTYTTDGTEVALVMNQRSVMAADAANISMIGQYITLFSPTIVQTYGATIDMDEGIYGASGTNDGTNWTSITIGFDTYGIPQGGGIGNATIPVTFSFNDGTTATYNVVVNNQ